MVHHIHWTKIRIDRIYSGVDPTCDCCHQGPATLAHTFWFCPALYKYWSKVLRQSLAMFSVSLLDSLPHSMILSSCKLILSHLTFLARCLILLRWKSPLGSLFHSLLQDNLPFMKLEKNRQS